LLRFRPDFYAHAHPGPEDTLLVIEVSESSAEPDREMKIPLYFRTGIVEAWLVDLAAEAIDIYRRPGPQGYHEVQRLHRGQRISLQALPGLELLVDEILGERTEVK